MNRFFLSRAISPRPCALLQTLRRSPLLQERPEAILSSTARSISEFPMRKDWLPNPGPPDFCGRGVPRQFAVRACHETRSSREICSWCQYAAAGTESCPGKTPSVPDEALPRSLCRSNRASPARKIQPAPRGECVCSPTLVPSDDLIAEGQLPPDLCYGRRVQPVQKTRLA